MGPAEHDDGGSLQNRINISRCPSLSFDPYDEVLDGLHGTPLVQEPHHPLDLDGGGVMERVYVPA